MVDKTSPYFDKYMAECLVVAEDIENSIFAVVEKTRGNKQRQGLDNPEITALRKEEARRLLEIQKKYGFD